VSLVNKGTGKNYGIEATLDKSFSNNCYFLINASVFDSKYKTLENIERNTKFNSNFIINPSCSFSLSKARILNKISPVFECFEA
jgi:hypothetical protein